MKVYIVSMLIEVPDDAPEPDPDVWAQVLAHVPNVAAIDCLAFDARPFPSIDEDPFSQTLH